MLEVRLDHTNAIVNPDEDLRFSVTMQSVEDVGPLRVGLSVFAADDTCVGTSFGVPNIRLRSGVPTTVDVVLPEPRLAPGVFSLALGVALRERARYGENLDAIAGAARFEVGPEMDGNDLALEWDHTWGPVRFPRPVTVVRPSVSA